ncbi:MAG: hypothetical protein ACJARS_004403, partial [bacterium]
PCFTHCRFGRERRFLAVGSNHPGGGTYGGPGNAAPFGANMSICAFDDAGAVELTYGVVPSGADSLLFDGDQGPLRSPTGGALTRSGVGPNWGP